MQIIQLLQLEDPNGYLDAIEPVYTAMIAAAERENDLRAYATASMMLKELRMARDMVFRALDNRDNPRSRWVYCYSVPPRLFRAESTDSISAIMHERDLHVHSPAMG